MDDDDSKKIARKFAEMTSIQGMSFIADKKRRITRLLWIICFLAALGMGIYQMTLLVIKYIHFDYNTAIDVGYAKLAFPSVTVCNINPIKDSSLTQTTQDFQNFITMTKGKPLGIIESAPIKGSTIKGGRQTPRFTTTTTPPTRRGGQNPRLTTTSATPPRGGNFQNRQKRKNFAPNRNFRTSEKRAKQAETMIDFQEQYANLDRSTRVSAGHQASDFIIECAFGQYQCNSSDFEQSLSPKYGNCYTFNSPKLFESPLYSALSGSDYGLDLVLNLESSEYISEIVSSTGVSLAIHPYGSLAFPELNGLAVGPGQEALFGIMLTNITRLGRPYGDCADDVFFGKSNYGKLRYTKEACNRFCPHQAIVEDCSCFLPPFEKYYTEDVLSRLPSCLSTTDLVNCSDSIYQGGYYDEDNCTCFPPCWEQTYQVETSYNTWPHELQKEQLVTSLCDFINISGLCSQTGEKKQAEFIPKNLLKLRVYYRDLNYQNIIQLPDYELSQFLSDIGGTLGLWIGVTALSVIELLDLIGQCCCRRLYKKPRGPISEKADLHHEMQMTMKNPEI